MATATYLMWSHAVVGSSCRVTDVVNVDKAWQLQKGVSRARTFPADAEVHMHPRSPKSVGLTDNLRNGARLVVASAELTNFLRGQELKQVEYLPVTVKNHKGRAVKVPYFIVHPVEPIDCLDIAASNPTMNEIIPSDIDWVEQIVLDHARIDPARRLFRVARFSNIVFVRDDLAKAVSDGGFSGVAFENLDEYEGSEP